MISLTNAQKSQSSTPGVIEAFICLFDAEEMTSFDC